MAYSSADLASVEAAVIALAAGRRTASVTVEGKRIDYAQTDLAALQALRDRIKAEVAAAGTTPPVRRIRVYSTKGL